MFGVKLFSLQPSYLFPFCLHLWSKFISDRHLQWESLASQLSAVSLIRFPPWVGPCLCLFVPGPHAAVRAEASSGQGPPLLPGWKPASVLASISTFLLSLDVWPLWMPFFIASSVMHFQWLLKTLPSIFSCFRGKVVHSTLSIILPETEEPLSNFCPSKLFAGFQGSRREAGKWRHILEQWALFRELTFKLTFLVTIIWSVTETEVDKILWSSWLFEECWSFKFLQKWQISPWARGPNESISNHPILMLI